MLFFSTLKSALLVNDQPELTSDRPSLFFFFFTTSTSMQSQTSLNHRKFS
ncbi:hypothetical protein Scep_011352 [Stephania cephalantha]|uniref:Uncharacterized protein n=1 Tax=Stephania cephalantha TaxID=152367 RepID=A0AAP0JD67_9MAGN